MALAFLFKKLALEHPGSNTVIKPFVVNHLARPESTEEAYSVSRSLKEIGAYYIFLAIRYLLIVQVYYQR